MASIFIRMAMERIDSDVPTTDDPIIALAHSQSSERHCCSISSPATEHNRRRNSYERRFRAFVDRGRKERGSV
jgi:hypothetical protein